MYINGVYLFLFDTPIPHVLYIGCATGDIQLTGFTNPWHGRVDICVDGVWGSVCESGFGVAEAAVVCRQLGYSSLGTCMANTNFPN